MPKWFFWETIFEIWKHQCLYFMFSLLWFIWQTFDVIIDVSVIDVSRYSAFVMWPIMDFPLTPTHLAYIVIEWPLLGFAKSFEWLWNPTKLFVKVHTYRMYLEHSRNWTLEHYQNWSALPLPTMYPTKWVQLSCRNQIVLT